MKVFKIVSGCVLSFVCIASASLAFGAAKQCEKYADACKAQSNIKSLAKTAKVPAIHQCIMTAAAADGAQGAACIKEQSGRKAQ